MNFTFTPLGTASATPSVYRYPSAHVLNIRGRLFLIDCGEACQIRLRACSVPFLKIDHILISHLHGDHVFGLFGLLSSMAMIGRTSPLNLYGPLRLQGILRFFSDYFGEGVKFPIAFHPIARIAGPELVADFRNLSVFAFPLEHRTEAFGFLFREKDPERNVRKEMIAQAALSYREIARLKSGETVVREDGSVLDPQAFTYIPWKPRSFAYCSDTAPFPALADWVRGVDLLYHEATFSGDLVRLAAATGHSTAAQTGACARDAGAGHLLIGHFSARYPDPALLLEEARAVFARTDLAHELQSVEVPLQKFE